MSDAVPSRAATRSKWHLPFLLVPVACVVVAGYIANASWATLVNSHPAVLIALSPINRYLLLTTNELERADVLRRSGSSATSSPTRSSGCWATGTATGR